MKTLLFGTVGALAMVTSASAADLAPRPYTKEPTIMSAMYDWSGFYIGGNGGWGSSHKCWDFSNAAGAFNVSEGCHDATGGTAGGQVGYRLQSSSIVAGIEAQGNWANFRGSNQSIPFPFVVNATTVDAFGTFTGQIGYAWNNVLLYAKGGAAVTDRNYWFNGPGGALASSTGYDTRWSPTVGAGLEFGFYQNWSLGIEYNHIFEDRHGATFVTPAGVAFPGFRTGGDTDMVLGKLNYKFGGPVIAKY
jgi:outer membrane immunogenic protein